MLMGDSTRDYVEVGSESWSHPYPACGIYTQVSWLGGPCGYRGSGLSMPGSVSVYHLVTGSPLFKFPEVRRS